MGVRNIRREITLVKQVLREIEKLKSSSESTVCRIWRHITSFLHFCLYVYSITHRGILPFHKVDMLQCSSVFPICVCCQINEITCQNLCYLVKMQMWLQSVINTRLKFYQRVTFSIIPFSSQKKCLMWTGLRYGYLETWLYLFIYFFIYYFSDNILAILKKVFEKVLKRKQAIYKVNVSTSS